MSCIVPAVRPRPLRPGFGLNQGRDTAVQDRNLGKTPMRRTTALALFTVLFSALPGCAYKSYWKQTNFKETPAPVAAQDVKVVKARGDLASEFTELGFYRGKAPTVAEAMDTAKNECGRHGANLYVLDNPPVAHGSGFQVEGVCGRR
jgi:hypothetical protein